MLGYITSCLPSAIPGGGQTPRSETLNGMLSQSFREEVHGSIVRIDCNEILVHYTWFSLRKVYACSTYKSTPPIPETVHTYDDKYVSGMPQQGTLCSSRVM